MWYVQVCVLCRMCVRMCVKVCAYMCVQVCVNVCRWVEVCADTYINVNTSMSGHECTNV